MTVKTCFNESDEANFVVGQIMTDYNKGANWRDNAILYRMNANPMHWNMPSSVTECRIKSSAASNSLTGPR